MAPVPPANRWARSNWVDSLGSAGALLCAIHCALLPFALALLPVLGLGMLASSTFEVCFVLVATALAALSFWQGHRHYRTYRALAFLVPGLLTVWAGVLVPQLHEHVVPHAVTMSLGGTLIAIAHLTNLRLGYRHAQGECCVPSA